MALLLCAPLLPASPGVLQGEVLETEGNRASGWISVRDAESRVTRCSYDGDTYVEIRRQEAFATQVRPGDRVELLVERQPGTPACYLRSVHLMPDESAASSHRYPYHTVARRGTLSGSSLYVLGSIYPRGNLTYAGVVVRLNPERLVLHTRSADEIIFLRGDTRYLESGLAVDASRLRVNRRVFIRAGRNLDQELEAFQVVWGDILQPK